MFSYFQLRRSVFCQVGSDILNIAGVRKILSIHESPQNSRRQKADMIEEVRTHRVRRRCISLYARAN